MRKRDLRKLQCMNGWVNGIAAWMDTSVAGWLAGSLAGWLDGWMDGWMDGWLAGWLACLLAWRDGCIEQIRITAYTPRSTMSIRTTYAFSGTRQS